MAFVEILLKLVAEDIAQADGQPKKTNLHQHLKTQYPNFYHRFIKTPDRPTNYTDLLTLLSYLVPQWQGQGGSLQRQEQFSKPSRLTDWAKRFLEKWNRIVRAP
ncbi:MAG: hypothetical protein AAFR05_15825 [Bacteroidota bacterium]